MAIKRKITVCLLLIAASYGVYLWMTPYPPQQDLTQQEEAVVETFLTTMQTRCVGRYLIDIPASFTLRNKVLRAFINDHPIRTQRIYPPAFEQKIRRREAQLSGEKTVDPLDMPFLKRKFPLPAGMVGVIFERNEDKSVPDAARILEAHLYTNGVAVEVEVEAENGTASRYDKDRQQLPEVYRNSVPQKMIELVELLKRIKGRNETDIPDRPGFCGPNMFITDGDYYQQEEVTLSYTSPEYPNIVINLDTDNFNREKDSLLERGAEINQIIAAAEGNTLQKGARNINGLYGEEWLVEGNGVNYPIQRVHRFALNVNEKTDSAKAPALSMIFRQEPLPDEQLPPREAVAAWERITSTLRLRPGAFNNLAR
ncbi:T6SS immunity protein Tli4 family protein [Brenneria sp. g21c3]|uniref:T6SS immunity protein Tli4 family protein n=1 Tax=Brenneria sp. g21c3 TaxID=3093893 RepID=UPI002EB141DC|nr:T6SS immunity protein Tli4 family protein [Brenneria sp. g21c3]